MTLDNLDKTFSEYVRLRDRISGTQYIKCISSGKIVHWKEADAGHFINRKHLSTRWDEQNVNAQSRADNRYDEGNMAGYSLGLKQKYGPQIIEKLLWKKQQTVKFTQSEITLLCKHYRKLVNELKQK